MTGSDLYDGCYIKEKPMERPITVNLHESLKDVEDRSCLVMDDDGPFVQRMARALAQRGFVVSAVSTVSEGKDIARLNPPAFAVLDLRLEDGSGLDVVEVLHKHRPDARAVILTGYGAIATAVAAVKAGAVDYLSKPADVEDIIRALAASPDEKPAPPENPMSADRVRWEHIQRVYELCNHNVSETARRLNMHRRTLQRILAKRAPR
ncbi:chemotaxis protein CheY [Hyphomonas sp. L-53-1-40]|jgi:two-component system response regulator RegA|uniref:Dna binding response regulator PrrA (RegA) n=2 Tax=root TaxID=1 RepID=A0A160TZA9_9ZZZZ|nr:MULTISPECIES: ActR/PrrA/RegA family redox response regulator transcription factor [unclassified Hyphomonas]KCZ61555.1 chemotaxis protein CheY [Hyphomonas sp. L-53-1-40]|tara:strand:- start:2664 stop:3284 length:621 start_codon:yes stop_codon:yes gene_type:complete